MSNQEIFNSFDNVSSPEKNQTTPAKELKLTSKQEAIARLQVEMKHFRTEIRRGETKNVYGRYDEALVLENEEKLREAERKLAKYSINSKKYLKDLENKDKEETARKITKIRKSIIDNNIKAAATTIKENPLPLENIDTSKENNKTLINQAASLEDLISIIEEKNISIQGSQEIFTSEMLKNVVTKIISGEWQAKEATRNDGFREKIVKLLKINDDLNKLKQASDINITSTTISTQKLTAPIQTIKKSWWSKIFKK